MAEMAAPVVLVRKSEWMPSAHYWATLVLAVALIPILHTVGLPLKFEWTGYFQSYWIVLAGQATFAACILYVAQFPYDETIAPIIRRLENQKARFLFLIPLMVFLIWHDGIAFGLVLLVDGIALLEFVDRISQNPISCAKRFLNVFIPLVYLFIAFILVFAYNDVIALWRYDGSWEFVLNRADAFLLSGRTISPLAHAVLSRWPSLIPTLQVLYFGMFAQVGAAIAILAWCEGRSTALKFVGTVIYGYYIALFIFCLMPAFGPTTICPDHFSVLPSSLPVYEIQKESLATLDKLKSFHASDNVGLDYLIGFPCMHLVQPLIVLWSLRKWKWMVAALIVYDILLVPAILLLEWHYVVDLVAAVPVAALAIAVTGRETHSDPVKCG
jgi:hypothetical protein